MATTFAESGSELAAGAAKRKRKRRRSPGGLGRGLARILTDTQSAEETAQAGRSGLLQLVGAESNAHTERIRRFVIDSAIATVVEAFALDGLLLAARATPTGGGRSERDGTAASHDLCRSITEPPSLAAATRFFESVNRTIPPNEGGEPPAGSGEGPNPAVALGRTPAHIGRLGGRNTGGHGANRAGGADGTAATSRSGAKGSHRGRGPNGAHRDAEHDDDRAESWGLPVLLASRLAADWASDSELSFDVYRQLCRALNADFPSGGPTSPGSPPTPDRTQEQWQLPAGRHWLLISRMDEDHLPVATVAVRDTPFSPAEAEAFRVMVGSVIAACSDSEIRVVNRQLIRAGTTSFLRSEGLDLLAEVNAGWELRPNGGPPVPSVPPGRRTGLGRGPDPVTAVARAAAKACRPRCEVAFAGSSEFDGVEVSIVMIRQARQGLRLGYAVRPKGDHSGAAEAVFTAAC